MPTPHPTDAAAPDPRATTTRRTLLAASTLAVSGRSGCLGRVASAVTETDAAPAAFYASDRRTTGANGSGDAGDRHRAGRNHVVDDGASAAVTPATAAVFISNRLL